jgi:two-component system, OmpR family, response regulator ResD
MQKSKVNSRTRQLPRILVVDANPGYRSVISHVVEMAGGQFESVAEIGQAKRQLDGAKRFDMVIIGTSADSPLTPEDVGKLRSVGQTPLIILAESYDETKQTLEVYKAGADQVLPKPFVPDALIGAINAEIRRPGPVSVVPMATRIEFGKLVFDAEKRRVTGEEGTVTLTKREWQLLSFFLASPNQFFQAAEVVPQAWGPEASVEQFRSYVTRLRQKLLPFKPYCGIVTEKGKGYCLVVVDQPAISG